MVRTMNPPLFSVIIPMYNVEQYIERCLQSVFDQDFLDENYEIVIINDGSPDNSESKARSYCEGRTNVKIISQENKGLGGARNTGIENAIGDYLIFLDSDDWLINDCFKTLSENLTKENIIEFSVVIKDDNSTLDTIDFPNTDIKSGVDYYFEHPTINSACNKIYKRTFLQEHELFFKERIYGEDIQFNSRVFYFAESIKSISNQLIVFYQSAKSITRNQDEKGKIKYLNDLEEVIFSLFEFKNSINTKEVKVEKYFDERIASLIVNSILYGLKNKISLSEMKSFVSSLKKKGSFDLSVKLKSRNLYRLLFKYQLSLNMVLYINKYRK